MRKKLLGLGLISVFSMYQTELMAIGRSEKDGLSFTLSINKKRPITGIVRDAAGIPIPGASIKVKRTNAGAVTNDSGQFTIEAEPTDVLIVSYIGFTTKEVSVGNVSDGFIISLAESSASLDQVVVVGYGTRTQREITSAITRVDSSQFRQSGARNALDLLQGKVAGLQISRNSTNPNSSPAIQLRGVINDFNGALIGPCYQSSNVEDYKKSVEAAMGRWSSKLRDLDKILEKKEWLLGYLTYLDFFLAEIIERFTLMDSEIGTSVTKDFPALQAHAKRFVELPA
ncbi:MAG: hypothetical protein EOO85_07910, partial [Pedobacter sp.]